MDSKKRALSLSKKFIERIIKYPVTKNNKMALLDLASEDRKGIGKSKFPTQPRVPRIVFVLTIN